MSAPATGAPTPCVLDDPDLSRRYAETLLKDLGLTPCRPPAPPRLPAWQRAIASGWASLTGPEEGPPELCPAPLTAAADGALAALAALLPEGALSELDGAALMGERAAAWGQGRRGLASPGGSCRLYRAADGWLALNRPRADDDDLLPAWLGLRAVADERALAGALALRPLADLLADSGLLGLAVAGEQPPVARPPWQIARPLSPTAPPARPPRVLDLSALWAGPLCGQLLRRAGAEVVKVESRRRPDGARQGPPAFYDRLNTGKASVVLDFTDTADRDRLHQLAEAADILIEASRPRALRQLGIDADRWCAEGHGRTWIRLRGYAAEDDPEGQRVAFGDDAGVAAGLSWLMAQHGERWLVGDAIADPLAGLHVALAGYALSQTGGGRVEVALVDVVRHALVGLAPLPGADAWRTLRAGLPDPRRWPAPRQPVACTAAAPLGADTGRILAQWRC